MLILIIIIFITIIDIITIIITIIFKIGHYITKYLIGYKGIQFQVNMQFNERDGIYLIVIRSQL